MNIFLFNPYLFHHIKDLFSVCQIRTPGKSASCRNRSRYRNQSAWYISFLAYLLHRHRIRRRMESYNKFHYFFSHLYSITIGFLKDGRYDEVEEEIRQIHEACDGKILKVIIETCLLTEEEKIKMCEIVTKAGAEFIKTSTGFSTAGATFEDVKLMHDHVGEGVKVKAAGGISSFDDAKEFMSLGADRLGTSRLVKIMKNTDNGAGY